jgi:plasmid stabilization system protein ParE
MKYKLEILMVAQRELEEIALVHQTLVGAQSARKITNRIYDALELLQANPDMGVSCADKPIKLQGYRMLICGKYLCIYRFIKDTVYVYHIADSRADYPRLMAEIQSGS